MQDVDAKICDRSRRRQVMGRDLVRCIIFGVFGPSLGLLTFVVVNRGSVRDLGLDTLLIALLFVYLNGLVPALIAAAFDRYLDCRTRGLGKWFLCGCFGYVAAYMNVLVPILVYQPRWGLVGAIPAMICSAVTQHIIGPFDECARA
ncbi:conserved membrane protein of unknown function [Bradyrhizobium sp. ORS 285]|nr:conserved membrane hypothetical protein [Bradyrhizobium sp. ORS 285]SMX60053.1 conserved membrane protein of unknown function [Bradyrhizobium sp. ORS 285]